LNQEAPGADWTAYEVERCLWAAERRADKGTDGESWASGGAAEFWSNKAGGR
jgi:hypothetical protein